MRLWHKQHMRGTKNNGEINLRVFLESESCDRRGARKPIKLHWFQNSNDALGRRSSQKRRDELRGCGSQETDCEIRPVSRDLDCCVIACPSLLLLLYKS